MRRIARIASDGKTIVYRVSKEEIDSREDLLTSLTPEQIEAKRQMMQARLDNPALSAHKRALLEIEIQIFHLPTVDERKTERFRLRGERHRRIEAERRSKLLPPRILPDEREAYQATMNHPLYGAARGRQHRRGLSTTWKAIRERIVLIEAERVAKKKP